MKLSEFLKKIDVATQKNAKIFNSKIRELEEESPGRFVAFVDDGNESYDVLIVIDAKTLSIQESSCDCDQKSTCGHIIAVMTKLNSGKAKTVVSLTVKRLKKKKLSEADKIIEQLDTNRIVAWLADELNSNNELFIKFKNHFQTEEVDISPNAIQQNYKACLKAVFGKKRKITLSELPKLIKLLALYDNKVFEVIKHDISSDKSLAIIHELMMVYENISDRLEKHTTRIKTYLKKYFDRIGAAFGMLHSKQFNDLFKTSSKLYSLDLDLLIPIIHENVDKLDITIKPIISVHLIRKVVNAAHSDVKDWKRILELVYDLGQFEKFYNYFPTFHWGHEYNISLLEKAEEYSKVDFISETCEELINSNSGYYCLPYVRILRSLFHKLDDKEYLKRVLEFGFEVCPDFEGFKMLYESSNDVSEKMTLVKKVNSLRLDSYQKAYSEKLELKFAVWNYIKKYDKILSKIETSKSFWEAVKYEKELLKHKKHTYLRAMITCDDLDWDYYKLAECLPYLEKLIKEHYTKQDLAIVSENIRLYSEELKGLLGI